MGSRCWLWGFALFAASAVAGQNDSLPADESRAALAPHPAYRLGPGDVVDIHVFEVEELSKPAVLSPEGMVSLPLVGSVELGGLTARQAAQRLRELYASNFLRDPQISLTVKEYRSQPVTVLGAVARPGVYQLRGPRRLSDVLALAEGLAADAGGRITISRALSGEGEEAIVVQTSALLSLSGPGANPPIQPHDTIRVSKAGIVYVVGEVGRAGGFPLRDQEQITVLKALSLAEGLRRTSSPQKSKIIRTADGLQREMPVRVGDILEGRAPDVPLLPNDVLFVPHSQAKSAMGRAAEAALQITTGVIIWRR